MKILGIDTTTKVFSAGLYDNGKIYEYNLEVGTRLSSLLSPTIERILGALGWRIGDIDYFACGIGPGSFTGIRLGLSYIKGLSWSLHKPVAGLPTLDIVASDVKIQDRAVIPAIDAKRNMVYCSAYRNNGNVLRRVSSYQLLTLEEFFKKAEKNSIIVGDAAGMYREKILLSIKGASIQDKDSWYPKGHNIIALVLEYIKNKKVTDAFKLKPIYLYPKECQIKNPKT